jgi:ubiquinone/menaquinone biosynthesis C-methylase UbiE|tara:strand:- start:2198 stop:2857 length:660 start_codon:yes stop_codon:yes gene_type:complete
MKINLLKSLPKTWKKKPLKIRKNASIEDRILSWRLDREYFDGNRQQGYAGYKYDGRWKPVARDFIKHYNLKDNSKILDIGCAKGYLLDEFSKLLKKPTLCGLDISHYAITKNNKKIIKNLCIGNATKLPFENNYFDLVISINSLHNIMDLKKLKKSFKEINRVSKENVFISLGAYDTKKERKILDNWAVVATAYMSTKSWLKFFKHVKYKGNYWWFKPN